MTEYPYVVISAMQRSGTNALKSILEQTTNFIGLRESFNYHDDNLEQPESFFSFKIDFLKKDLAVAIPTEKNQSLLWREFLKHIHRCCAGKIPVLDIKYNSYHHLDPVWKYFNQAPKLCQLLMDDRAKIINIERRNKCAQALSILVSDNTQVYHLTKFDDMHNEGEEFEISLRELKGRTRSIERCCSVFNSHFTDYPNYLRLYYEDLLTDAGRLTEQTRSRISEFLDQEIDDCETHFRKTGPVMNQRIKNYRSVEKLVNDYGKDHFQ